MNRKQLKELQEYNRKVIKGLDAFVENSKKADIVLSPIESIPMPSFFHAFTGGRNWGLDYMEVEVVREKIAQKQGKRKVIVFVFDTAGEYSHSSLEDIAFTGKSYTGEPLTDGHGHGTHVAGTICSTDHNLGVGEVLASQGFLNPVPMKMLTNGGLGYTNKIIDSVEDANPMAQTYINQGYAVIYANSWGGGGVTDPKLEALYKKAEEMGVIICFASGNNGSGQLGQPAESEYNDAVGAIDQNGNKASFSQFGKGLDFTAPGVQILSCWPGNKTAILNGTSMAQPHVAGAYAMVLSYWSEYTPFEIRAHFQKWATDIAEDGYDEQTGFGVPVLKALIDNEPVKGAKPIEPGEGVEPPEDDDIIREQRTITTRFEGLKIVWGIGNMNDQRPLEVSIVVEMVTKLQAPVIFDKVKKYTEWFFHNRGIMFGRPDADVYDALKFTIVFFELLSRGQDFDVNVSKINGVDEDGRFFYLDGDGIGVTSSILVDELPSLYEIK